jgi:probable addiction module antidote protein
MQNNTSKTTAKAKAQSESYEDFITEKYRNKEYASLALENALLETDEPRLLCIVLQRIIKANGGFTNVSRLTGMLREDLYRAVSLKTTPKIHIVYQILSALDIRFSFPIPMEKKAKLIPSKRNLHAKTRMKALT